MLMWRKHIIYYISSANVGNKNAHQHICLSTHVVIYYTNLGRYNCYSLIDINIININIKIWK